MRTDASPCCRLATRKIEARGMNILLSFMDLPRWFRIILAASVFGCSLYLASIGNVNEKGIGGGILLFVFAFLKPLGPRRSPIPHDSPEASANRDATLDAIIRLEKDRKARRARLSNEGTQAG